MGAIVWLTENYPPQRGGMAQSCDRIVRSLRAAGLSIHVVHFTSRSDGYHTEKKQNGSYTPIPVEEDEAHVLNRTWTVLQRFENVSHLVCFGGHLSMLGAPVFSRWFDWKLVTLIRGNDFDVSLFSPRKKGLLEDLLTQSNQIAAVSRDKQEKVLRLFGKPCHYIPNGIELDHWQPSPNEIAFAEAWRRERLQEGKKCIGLFGQLKSKKGGDFFFESVWNTSIAKNLVFLVVGEVAEELNDKLKEWDLNVEYLPFLDRFELLRHYLCCDAVAIPSFYDGMPNVLLEAGALGIPVLASDTDGMKDLIEDGQDGWLFANGNSDSCREALYRFSGASEVELNNIKNHIKSKIYASYTHLDEAQDYLDLFSDGFVSDRRRLQQQETR